jgi:hypothetical protein
VHLHNIYGRLGVRKRTLLAVLVLKEAQGHLQPSE